MQISTNRKLGPGAQVCIDLGRSLAAVLRDSFCLAVGFGHLKSLRDACERKSPLKMRPFFLN